MDLTSVLVQGASEECAGAVGGGLGAEAGVSAVVGALLPLIVGMLKKKA